MENYGIPRHHYRGEAKDYGREEKEREKRQRERERVIKCRWRNDIRRGFKEHRMEQTETESRNNMSGSIEDGTSHKEKETKGLRSISTFKGPKWDVHPLE